MSIGNGAPAWPSVIVSNGGISPSDHIVGYIAMTPGAAAWRGYVGRRFEPVGIGPRAAMQEAVVRRALEALEDREETHGAYHCFS
jgi:hypothetical protein